MINLKILISVADKRRALMEIWNHSYFLVFSFFSCKVGLFWQEDLSFAFIYKLLAYCPTIPFYDSSKMRIKMQNRINEENEEPPPVSPADSVTGEY